MGVGSVQLFGLPTCDANRHGETSPPERHDTSPPHSWVRVGGGDDHSVNPRADHGWHAGRRSFTKMATGFKRDVKSCAARTIAGLTDGEDFRMGKAWPTVISLTDHLTILDDQGADHRIGTGGPSALRREPKGLCHELKIARHRFLLREGPFLLPLGRDAATTVCLVASSANAAWAAASRAMATR